MSARPRRPIRWQLVAPTVALVVAAILAASGASGLLAARAARQQHVEALQRVVTTLTEAQFPLTEAVLRQMSGLSGAQFVLLDRRQAPARSSLPLPGDALPALRGLPTHAKLSDLGRSETIDLEGTRYLADRLSLRPSPTFASGGSLIVLYPEDQWSRVTREAWLAPLALGALAATVAAVVMSLLARRFVRPIEALRRHAAQVAAGGYDLLAVPATNDELCDLVVDFNDMATRLSRSEEMVRRSERLTVLGRLGGGLAHQLRNAVTGARIALDHHRRECPACLGEETLCVAARQLELMESHLQRFLTLGRPWSRRPEPLDLADVVVEALELLAHNLRHASIAVEQRLPAAGVRVEADRGALHQVLVNVLINAQEAVAALPDDRRIRLELTESNGAARLVVADNGPGPAADMVANMFEPLVSSRPEGTGLGLAVAREIAEAHGGSLTFRREKGWTLFELILPQIGRDAGASESPDALPRASAASLAAERN